MNLCKISEFFPRFENLKRLKKGFIQSPINFKASKLDFQK